MIKISASSFEIWVKLYWLFLERYVYIISISFQMFTHINILNQRWSVNFQWSQNIRFWFIVLLLFHNFLILGLLFVVLVSTHCVHYFVSNCVDGINSIRINLWICLQCWGYFAPTVFSIGYSLIFANVLSKSWSSYKLMKGTSKAFLTLIF